MCINGGDSPAVLAVVTAAVASAAAIASVSLKMLWWLAMRSQVSWEIGVDNIVLVIFAGLLSSSVMILPLIFLFPSRALPHALSYACLI